MGLSIDPNGNNIAYCGGTGVLVFLDLVALVALQMCSVNKDYFGPNFKFQLYYATASEE